MGLSVVEMLSLNLQHRPFNLSFPLCKASSLSCGLPAILSLPTRYLLRGLPIQLKGQRRGEEREEKWCHTAMMPEHCLGGGEVEGVWIERKRWRKGWGGGEGVGGGSSPKGVQPL